MFFWNSLSFAMIQWMLAVWSLVPLPFLYPAWTSGSSQFTYCWSLAWRILSHYLVSPCHSLELRIQMGISFLFSFAFHFSSFFSDPADVGNLISGFSAFSKTNLNIRKFTVHVLLKPSLKNFKHYFTSVWKVCDCAVVWAFFGIAFILDWNENWSLPVL